MACLPLYASPEDVRGSLARSPSASVAFVVARDGATRRSVAEALSGAGFLTLTIDDPADAARHMHAMRPALIAIDADAYGRATRPAPPPPRVSTDDLEIDIAMRIVRRAGQWVDLTPREFELLAALVRRAPHVVPRDELVRDAWGNEVRPGSRTIDTHVATLRRKLERTPAKPRHIRTVTRVGYRFLP